MAERAVLVQPKDGSCAAGSTAFGRGWCTELQDVCVEWSTLSGGLIFPAAADAALAYAAGMGLVLAPVALGYVGRVLVAGIRLIK